MGTTTMVRADKSDAETKSKPIITLPDSEKQVLVSQTLNSCEHSLNVGRKRFQFLASLCAGIIGIQSGITLTWTSPILPYFMSEASFLPPLSEDQISWITSLLALGAIVGAVPAGKIADRIGRKWSILLTIVPFATSWLLLIFSWNVVSIYVARFVGGIGAGAACVLVPVYIGEIAQASIRGALTAFFPILLSLGIILSYVAGAYCSYVAFNTICCALLLPLVLGAPFMPESPIWLVQRGRKTQVTKVLFTLRGSKYDIQDEITVLQDDIDKMVKAQGGFRDLIGTRAGRRAIIVCVGLMSFQQLCGVDAILFYTVNIFQAANSTVDPYVASIVVGLVEVVITIVVAIVIDRFGRKPLLIISGMAMTIDLVVLGYYFKLKNEGDVSAIGWMPLTCLCTFNIFFSIGYGSVPFTVISEIFPPQIKGVASSVSIVVHWSLVFAVTKLFPSMEDRLGPATTFWTFACFTAMSTVFAFLLVPETKGKTLQEIQKKLERRSKTSTKYPVEPV